MKVARNTSHGLRHDWLCFNAEGSKIHVSLMAHRNEIEVDVTIDGKTASARFSPRQLAALLINATTDPHEQP